MGGRWAARCERHSQILVTAGSRVKRVQQDAQRTEMLDEAATDSNKNITRAIGSTCGGRRLARKRRPNNRIRYSRRDTHFVLSVRMRSNRLRQRSRGARAGYSDILRWVHARPTI